MSVLVVEPGTPAMFAVEAPKVARATVPPGETPEAPYALRSRNWFSQLIFGKKLSSEMIHERLAFGYTMFENLVPKELFWSERAAMVTNIRSRNAASSCT